MLFWSKKKNLKLKDKWTWVTPMNRHQKIPIQTCNISYINPPKPNETRGVKLHLVCGSVITIEEKMPFFLDKL